MPQPYRGEKAAYFAAHVMLERPDLAGRIAAIATLWTVVEDLWGVILGVLVGIEKADVGVSMYHALTGTSAQRSVLTEMARLYLPEEMKEEFSALMKVARKRAEERNAVVHGLWFYDLKMPDNLILAPRNEFSHMFVKLFNKVSMNKAELDQYNIRPEFSDEGWMVYSQKDFLQIAGRINEFSSDLDHFFDKLAVRRGYPTFGPPARPD